MQYPGARARPAGAGYVFAQVKTPSASAAPRDYCKMLGVIPGDQAFRPLAKGGCPLPAR